MPSANKATTPIEIDIAAVEGRYVELDDFTVAFETFKEDLDVAPYLRGLPQDRCTAVHVGVVTSGQIQFRWPDHEETYVEGDAYVAGPGHLPYISAGTSTIEFTRTFELGPVMEVIEGRYAALDDHTVSFETFKQDLDVAPYFKGLPGDACTCQHLGYVTAGQITFRWPDHEETYVEGDAYVAPPGHRPLIAAGTSVVEFSLTADLDPVMATIGSNIEAMAGAGS